MQVKKQLSAAKVEIHQSGLKMSGKNTFQGYEYFTLDDLCAKVTQILTKHDLLESTTYNPDNNCYELMIMSTSDDSHLIFRIPYALPQTKGTNDIQALGGSITYSRRYLLLMALQLTETDDFVEAAIKHEQGKSSNLADIKAAKKVTVKSKVISENQAKELIDICKIKGVSKADFAKQFGKQPTAIEVSEFKQVVEKLNG